MAGALKQSCTYRDAKGNTARVTFYVSPSGTLTTQNAAAVAVITALDALTNAHRYSATGPATEAAQPVVYGTNSSYASVEDKAIFTFTTATGAIHRFQIPAPLASIFLADGETIDSANTLVTAFNSAVVANVVSRDSDAVTFGANGTRIRRKARKRLNIFVLAPDLVGPAE